ncbi:MAG: KGG domain-containing protein [Acutalibacteraceae bacterium]|nr:KGG domain-containing protein [Acutalibacteraceae bacterium]
MNEAEKNLIPLDKRTKEERREIAVKGGKASGKARQNKKTIKEIARMFLYTPIRDEKLNKILDDVGIPRDEQTYILIMIFQQIRKAANGDIKAAEFIRETIGENPRLKLYERRLELLNTDGTTKVIDEWVNSIPEF